MYPLLGTFDHMATFTKWTLVLGSHTANVSHLPGFSENRPIR